MRFPFYLNEQEFPVGGAFLTDTPADAPDATPVEESATPADPLAQSATDIISEAQEPVADGTSLTDERADATPDAQEEGAAGIQGAIYASEDRVPTLGEGEVLLSVKNVDKAYKKGEYVLRNFSLDVCRGQIVGLLGPNGCGKTTLLKMIAGLLVNDGGSITIAGETVSEITNAYISYLPERTYFAPSMKVTALLDYFEDFYEDFNRTLAEDMLHDLDIPMDARLRTLSKGMKEKVQLVLVMSRKTKLYLLDEPIGGVDPAAREYVLNTILARYNTDASVIITTHLISDVEPILNSFAFLGYGGEILAFGQADDAREQTGKSLDELFREVFRCYRKL